MNKLRMAFASGLFLASTLGLQQARAVTGSWTNNNSGNWTNGLSWAGGVIPNYAGDIAYFTNDITAARTITISSTVTNGLIYLGDPDGSHAFTISGTAGTNIFDNNGNGAALTMTESSTNSSLGVPVILKDSLTITNKSTAFTLTASSGISGSGAISVVGGAGVHLTASNSYSGGTVLQSGALRIGHNNALGTGPLAIYGGTLDATTAGVRNLTNNNIQTWYGDFTFGGSSSLGLGTGAITLGGDCAITAVTNTLTIGGAISDGTNSYRLTKSGPGSMVLSGTNTHKGGTVLNDGELDLNSSYALGTGTLTINGGALNNLLGTNVSNNLNNNAQIWNSNFTFVARYPINIGTGAVALAGNVTITNPYSIYSFSLTVGGPIDDGTNSYALTFGGVNGGLTLAGANTYHGGTTLNGGKLYINNAQALGTGPLTINGGQIDNSSGSTISNANNNAQVWNGNFSFYGAATLHLGTGAVTLGSSIILSNINNLVSTSGPIDDGTNTYSLTKRGNGTLMLAGENTYGGGTTIDSGALQLDHPGAIAPGLFTINGGSLSSTLTAGYSNANNNAQVWNAGFSLVGGKSVHLGTGPVTLGGSLAITTLYAGITVGGVIDDGGNGYGLSKGGGNFLYLAGENTYSGETIVPTGTVVLTGSGSITNSAIITVTAPGILVASNRTDGTLTLGANQLLRGDGLVRGVVTNAGTIGPGMSPGRLTISGAYSQSGTLDVELGGTTPATGYDTLTVSNSATLGGTLKVSLINAFAPAEGNSFTVLTASAVSGTFATTNLPAGNWTVTYQAKAVVVTYVDAGGGPELGVSPASLNFGSIRAGESADLVFIVTNSGTAQLDGTATVSGVSFAIQSGSPFSVAAGSSANITIRFAPTETTDYSGSATFLSNGGGSTNAVSGAGYVQSIATNGSATLVGGQPAFGFTLVSGALYRVQATTNLLDGAGWSDLTGYLTNNYPGGAIPAFVETNTTANPRRAYRISSP